ncbi:MAG: TonB-dependent receptor, partial [Bacteroidales bacterium]|nr:TonB-dependent receptor [Bacteroidales bacterium]
MLHKIKALLALFLFSAMGMQAQFSVSGKITDKETGENLPGAHIKLGEQLAVSNSQGFYQFNNVKAGVYPLEVSYLGYSIFHQELKLDKNQIVNMEMTLSPKMEDAVVIVAHRANDKMGTSFTNLTKMDIKKADAGMDIPYLIEMTPGLVTNSDAGTGIGYTSMRIRGSDPTRINVTINGIPFNDPESQGTYFVNLPDLAGSLNNVQIQRGVGTSVNGAAAFGATIDMQTQGLQADPMGELSLSYGSFNTQRYRLAASTGLIADKYSFDVRLSSIHSDGYIDRASADLKSFFVTGARYGKNSILRINVFSGNEKTYQAWSGVPKDSLKTNRTFNPYSYENEVDNYTQTHYHLLYSVKAGKKWILNSALFYTKGYGYYENFKEDESLSG